MSSKITVNVPNEEYKKDPRYEPRVQNIIRKRKITKSDGTIGTQLFDTGKTKMISTSSVPHYAIAAMRNDNPPQGRTTRKRPRPMKNRPLSKKTANGKYIGTVSIHKVLNKSAMELIKEGRADMLYYSATQIIKKNRLTKRVGSFRYSTLQGKIKPEYTKTIYQINTRTRTFGFN